MPLVDDPVFGDLIGGEYGAPAFQQRASGAVESVPRATLESVPELDLGEFSDLAQSGGPQASLGLGEFSDLIEPAEGTVPEKSRQALYEFQPGMEQIRATGPQDASLDILHSINKWSGKLLEPGKTSAAMLTPETAKKAIDFLIASLPGGELTQALTGKVGEGVVESVADAASGATVPENMAMIPAMALIPGLAEAYAINVLTDLPQQYGALSDSIKKYGLVSKETAATATRLGITDIMGFLAAKGGASGRAELKSQFPSNEAAPKAEPPPLPSAEPPPIPAEVPQQPQMVSSLSELPPDVPKSEGQLSPEAPVDTAAPPSPRTIESGLSNRSGTESPQAEIPSQANAATPNDFTPALKTESGEIITGEKGKVHQDIYNSQPDPVELRASEPEHGFVDADGNFKTRQEVADALGEKEPMQSERLRELQSQEPPPIPSSVPEHLRPDPEVERLTTDPEAQTGPQIKAPTGAPEGGALFSRGGSRPKVTPKGTTAKGDTEFLRIPKGRERILHGLEREGAADVIGRTKNKVGQKLAEATRRHVDLEQEIHGQLHSVFEKAMQGAGKKEVGKAFDELEPYIAAKENGRPLPTISPLAKKLMGAWEKIADDTGNMALANNVQVFDKITNSFRPMQKIGGGYIPRMFKPEVERVMQDPKSNPTLWNKLVDDFATHRGITPDEAAKELRTESSRFQSNDFMGNLEMARTGQLPESFYDYDLRRLASRYIPNFSERMAQIIAYGQRLGERGAPKRPNLWDVARGETQDVYSQNWLNQAEDLASGVRSKNAGSVGMARAQTFATGTLLSAPQTVIRNLLSGLTSTTELMGIRRSIAPLLEAARKAQARMDAREIGTVRENIGDFLHADQLGKTWVDDALRYVTDKLLKYSTYNGSEVFVRTHGGLAASQFAKDGVAAINRNPSSGLAKEALAMFKRMGVDAEKIVKEGADWKTGPETRKFIRTVIRDTQGGYRFDQVPLWASTPTGRFFYQFGRWGTQRARNIYRNGIKPMLGEEVQWHGKTMTHWNPFPLMKMLGGTLVLGEAFAGISNALFGRDRKDASIDEIVSTFSENESLAVGLAFERAVNDVIMSGTLGIWGQPVDWVKGFKDQSRLKNPAEPPGTGAVVALGELAKSFWDQGFRLTKNDLLHFTGAALPGLKQVSDIARNALDEPLYEAQNDIRSLRAAGERWAKQTESLEVVRKSPGQYPKSKHAPEYEPIKEALQTGDLDSARVLFSDWLNKQPNRATALKSIKASIRASQPFRVGPYTSEEHRQDFKKWAEKHLSDEDLEQTNRIQERYVKTAKSAGLW
jgi:hypothetical protein